MMNELIFTNARLVDGMGGVEERATVRVADGRIAEVGAEADAGSR